MPGLMALRAEFGESKPLAGARIAGSLHMTVQTAVLIETLVALGAQVRWASCNIFSTQDEAAAAVAVGPTGTRRCARRRARLRLEGRDARGVLVVHRAHLRLERRGRGRRRTGGPNLILDDGGDATLLVHKGREFELAGAVPATPRPATADEYRVVLDAAARVPRARSADAGPASPRASSASPRRRRPACTACTSWRHPVSCCSRRSTSTTRSRSRKFDNKYGIRHSLPDGLNRATDVLIGGKVAFVAGYGDVGKGAAEALRGQGARVIVSEVDPICALQAAMDGFQVARLESVDRRGRHPHHRHRQHSTSSPSSTCSA